MDFVQAVQTCLSKYATFSGRAQRSEYWYFALFTFGLSVVASLLDNTIFGFGMNDEQLFSSIVSMVLFIPSVAAAVRRLHDTEKSGWWWWLWLIPIVGWIILLVWLTTKGTSGTNLYGSDPFGDPANFGDQTITHKSSIPRISRDG